MVQEKLNTRYIPSVTGNLLQASYTTTTWWFITSGRCWYKLFFFPLVVEIGKTDCVLCLLFQGSMVNVTPVMLPARPALAHRRWIVLLVSKVQTFALGSLQQMKSQCQILLFNASVRLLCHRIFSGPGKFLCRALPARLLRKLCHSAVRGLLSKLWGVRRHQW